MELALFSLSIETMLPELAKDFPDVSFMLSLIIRKDKYSDSKKGPHVL